MTRQQWGDAADRAAWTFVQGAISVAPVGPVADWTALRSALVVMAVGGGAALLSALKSMVKAKRTS